MRVSVIGTGAVGIASASALLFKNLCDEICLSDVKDEKAEGEAWDFQHVAALHQGCRVTSLPFAEAKGLDICVLAAGVKSKPGESRLELLERNLNAANSIAETLEKNGLPKIMIVLTNPVDLLTEFFTRRWTGKTVNVFGSGTSLDTMRLRHLLAESLGLSASNIHSWVVGEHGDSSVCLLESAAVGSIPLSEFASQKGVTLLSKAAIEHNIRGAAYRIIERKGATSHAIGWVAARLVEAVIRNENLMIPVSVRVKEKLCASLPCLISSHGASKPFSPAFSQEERRDFEKSLATLEAAAKVSHLLA